MASIRWEIVLEASPDRVWAAVRDLGALSRLAPGVVADSTMEDGMRMVTYADGPQLREWIVDLDEAGRRLVVTATGGSIAHLNSAVQVFAADEGQSRVVWICDFLPDAIAGAVRDKIERLIAAAKMVLENEPPET